MVADSGTASRTIAIFFYGLFMDAASLRRQGLHPDDPRRAAVLGMALRIGQRATLVPSVGGTVHGMVMMLNHAEIDRLYSKASVALYRPEAILARLENGTSVPALCFTLPMPPEPSERNPDYERQLAALGHRLGLPAEYVRSFG